MGDRSFWMLRRGRRGLSALHLIRRQPFELPKPIPFPSGSAASTLFIGRTLADFSHYFFGRFCPLALLHSSFVLSRTTLRLDPAHLLPRIAPIHCPVPLR